MKTLYVIENDDHKDLHMRVSTRPQDGPWPMSVMIEQGQDGWMEDCVLIDSEQRCKHFIEAVRKAAAELGWEV